MRKVAVIDDDQWLVNTIKVFHEASDFAVVGS